MEPRLRARMMPHAAAELDVVQDVVRAFARRAIVDQPSQNGQVLVTSIAVRTIAQSSTTVLYRTSTLPVLASATPPATVLSIPQQDNTTPSATPSHGSYIGTNHPESMMTTTTKVIIIAAAAGFVLALAIVGFFCLWRRARQRRRLYQAAKSSFEEPSTVTDPLGSNWGRYNWDPSATFAKHSTYAKVVETPEPAYVRPSTSSSNRAVPTRAPYAPPNIRSANANETPLQSYPIKPSPSVIQQPVVPSRPGSPSLPLQRPGPIPSSLSQDSTLVPEPAKASRFSRWTNSVQWKAPPRPKTPPTSKPQPSRDSQLPDASPDRYSTISAAESEASVARYRTVESWVGQQAGRYEERRVQERIGMQLDAALDDLQRSASTRSSDRKSKRMTKMKTIPLEDSSSVFVDGSEEDERGDEVTELSLIPEAAKTTVGANVLKRTKSAKHRTNESDLTVFRAHPGTRVDIPPNTRIPSEILDNKFASNTYGRF